MANESMIGADLEAMRNFALELDRAAVDVLAARKYVNTIVINNNAWFGPHAAMFVAAWGKLAIELTHVSGQLEAAGRSVSANAAAQAGVSGDLGVFGGGILRASEPAPGNSAIGSRTGSSTREFLDQIDPSTDGIRIQQIEGADGQTRYIVHLGGSGSGTQGDPLRAVDGYHLFDWGENAQIVTGQHSQTTQEILRRMKDFGVTTDDEILFVGFSQGGGHSELIAESGLFSNVTVINEGGPSTPGGDGSNVLRLEADDIPSNAIEAVSGFTAGRGGTIFDGAGSHTDHGAYGRAADEFDASTDPAHQHLQEQVDKFRNGVVIAEAETSGRLVSTSQFAQDNPDVVVEEVVKAAGTVFGAIGDASVAGGQWLGGNRQP